MARAVELAARGTATALPNPVVGCVLLAPDGATVGEGWHERPGGPHAEVHALRAAGGRARGATAVVTLEPCAHTGRTGPCTEALLAAGVARVVVAVRDPWATAAGGAERLRAAGVDVEVGPGAAAAERVNAPWLLSVRLGRPYVTWKTAATLDGRSAAEDGTSRWITGEAARADVHRLRGEVDTVLAGVGTVLADDPQLTVRPAGGGAPGRPPLRVVADTHGRTPAGARVRDGAAPTWVATAREVATGPDGHLDPAALLAALHARGRVHVLLEGGPRLAGAFVREGLVDRVVAYVAPALLGSGAAALGDAGVRGIAGAHRLRLEDVARVGEDVRLTAVPLRPAPGHPRADGG
ncbi:bifunctional diaminohydroxyphosphoribosylaminopyrimidine deaminase/5-amino-6-(5-phosphoribosylamino)uracil reductase RibD [Vallicoccus soli]